jgi:hypothetical protein
MFQELQLPMPPVPMAFMPLVGRTAQWVFSSRSGLESLIDLDLLVQEAETGDAPLYVAFSHEGRGTNSWSVRYVVITTGVSAFIELPLGGAYGDVAAAVASARETFSGMERLIVGAADAEEDIIIDLRPGRSSRWRWRSGIWQASLRPLDDALSAQREQLAAKDDWYTGLSQRVWKRHPSRSMRFLFARGDRRGLVLESASAAGLEQLEEHRRRLSGQATREGVVLVDAQQRFVFCGPGLDGAFLVELATWARAHAAVFAGAAGLIDAQFVNVAVDVADDAAIRMMSLDGIEPQGDPSLWDGLHDASPARVAAVLEAARPGQRHWYWLSPEVLPDGVPLVVEPVDEDPVRDRMDRAVSTILAGRPDEGAAGICVLVDGGQLQFQGRSVAPFMLRPLADWVAANLSAHPALARLADCQLVWTPSGSRVDAVFEDSDAWDGVRL